MQFIENKIDIRIINKCIVLCRGCIVQGVREVSSGSWEIRGLSGNRERGGGGSSLPCRLIGTV